MDARRSVLTRTHAGVPRPTVGARRCQEPAVHAPGLVLTRRHGQGLGCGHSPVLVLAVAAHGAVDVRPLGRRRPDLHRVARPDGESVGRHGRTSYEAGGLDAEPRLRLTPPLSHAIGPHLATAAGQAVPDARRARSLGQHPGAQHGLCAAHGRVRSSWPGASRSARRLVEEPGSARQRARPGRCGSRR